MEVLVNANEVLEMENERFCKKECKAEMLMDLNGVESEEISDILGSEITLNDEHSSSDYSSSNCFSSEVSQEVGTIFLEKTKLDKQGLSLSGANH